MQTEIAEKFLDVTLLEPRQKHPTIFVRFDGLKEGESLTIQNDHDPKPLYYQLLGERGDIFSWEYLQEGPTWWKVKITKRFAHENEKTLGEIAARDLRKAEVFKKYGLDFCCGGKKTLRQACAEKGLDSAKIEQELQHVDGTAATRAIPYDSWSLDFLIDYILNTHHSYVRKTLPEISSYAAKVATVHVNHPELLEVQQLVDEISREISSHMLKEEIVLFPYIKHLVASVHNEIKPLTAHFGSVENPITMMEMEHEMVGKNMDEIRILTNNYKLPEDACASYKLLFSMLEKFGNDLQIHVHLENNILFPKALEIEKKSKR